MNRYFVKPLFWNFGNYERPTGAKAASGYPQKYGFGHEEWNNNPGNRIRLDGVWHRVLHITGLDPVKEIGDDDNVVVFLIASWRNVQYLLGIASGASRIANRTEQRRVQRALDIASRWRDAWQQPRVQSRPVFRGDVKRFRKFWRDHRYGDINWKCPEDHVLWFPRAQRPRVSALKVTGKKRFPSMYGSFAELTADQVERLLESAGLERTAVDGDGRILIRELKSRVVAGDDSLEEEIAKIKRNRRIKETTRKALIDARYGQGQFRNDLSRLWGNKCCITSCSLGVALRASHIRPWKDSSNADRLDPENGLLLVATLDALFDRGWISFNDDGSIKVSSSIDQAERKRLGLNGLRIRKSLSQRQKRNLHFHRTKRFDKHQRI